MTVFKIIKPKRLKDKDMRLELLNAMRKVGRKIKLDFEKTVENWSDKPEFELLISLTGPGPVAAVVTDSEIYRYVDKGTDPHIIVPVNAKVLHFTTGYRAKTQPGFIGTVAGGGSYDGEEVFAKYVLHPGTEAREFEKTIAEKWRKAFRSEMEEAMKRAVQKSGHKI